MFRRFVLVGVFVMIKQGTGTHSPILCYPPLQCTSASHDDGSNATELSFVSLIVFVISRPRAATQSNRLPMVRCLP